MHPIERDGERVKIGFDENGPRLGSVRLLASTTSGFRPRSRSDIAQLFATGPSASFDIERFEKGLVSIASAMNAGNLGLAGITSCRLPCPTLTDDDLTKIETLDRLLKAAVDDPDHPGYPKGKPDGKRGQFRPKDADAGNDNGPIRFAGAAGSGTAKRLERLKQRRGLRSAFSRILTIKRIARLVGENTLAGVTEVIPLVDAATDAVALADDIALVSEIAAYRVDTETAVAFVEKGPAALEDLLMSAQETSFSSFPAFKKMDELEKIFGAAGDGMDYHHIVEQAAIGDTISTAEVQSTRNIVKIPRLLHEEINSIYATSRDFGGVSMTPRDYLRGKSFKEQYNYGLYVLKNVGLVH